MKKTKVKQIAPSAAATPSLKKQLRLRKGLRKRVRGKPGFVESGISFPRFLIMFCGQAFKILLFLFLVVGFLLAGLGSGMLTGYISTAQKVEVSDMRKNLTNEETVILDKDGAVVSKLKTAGSVSEFVPIGNIKETYLDDAFIAIEDERFASHPGIDFKRIGSAVFSALRNAGTPTHGGSTITQQVVKLISGKDDISAQRKIQEWYNAIRLEQSRSKDSIMELYLNLVPMANNYVGVQAAAKAYFNKNASELNLAESALLAGIPNRPATYNPMTEYGRRNCLRRMRLILGTMLETGTIQGSEYDQALNQEIQFDFSQQSKKEENIQSWFVDYLIQRVRNDLITRKGYSEELANIAIYQYGLIIESTLDKDLQDKLQTVFKNESLFVTDPSQIPDSPERPQAGISVLDNLQPGLIRGLVGGFGEKKRNFGFNLATDAKRQPGSSIKPILVYAPALEVSVISQATPFDDKEMFLDPDRPDVPYPLNYSRTYKGPVTLEYAILYSLNTIAAEVYSQFLGPEVGLSFLKACGLDRSSEPYVSGALGGFSQGMSTLEMAAAYSVFPNAGLYVEPVCYLRVLNQDGTVLLDNSEQISRQVYRPETCYVMTSMLEKVAEASWNNAQPPNTKAAGKTGTTEDYVDVWFCGYTPYYTAAVWYGYENANGRKTSIPEVDGKNACVIWRECMTALHSDLAPGDFARPSGVVNATVCKVSGKIAGEYCPEEDRLNVLLIEGAPCNPSETCDVHRGHPRPTLPYYPYPGYDPYFPVIPYPTDNSGGFYLGDPQSGFIIPPRPSGND